MRQRTEHGLDPEPCGSKIGTRILPSNCPPDHSAVSVDLRKASRLCTIAMTRSSALQPSCLGNAGELLIEHRGHLARGLGRNDGAFVAQQHAQPVQTFVALVAFGFALDLVIQLLHLRARRDVERCAPVLQSLARIVGTPRGYAGQGQQRRIAMDLQLGFQKVQRFLRTAGTRSARLLFARGHPDCRSHRLARTAGRRSRGSYSRPTRYPATRPGGEPGRNRPARRWRWREDNPPRVLPSTSTDTL